MKFGLALPHYDFALPGNTPLTFEAIRKIAKLAEKVGFDSIWVSDHLKFDLAKYGGDSSERRCFEWSSLLGSLSPEIQRSRLGVLVVCLPIRVPLLVARSAITLHNLTNARFELGLGAGWYRPDFEHAGVPYETASSRIQKLVEGALDIVAVMERTLDSDPDKSTRGLKRPPVTIGGKGGHQLLDAVARAADKWNISWAVTPNRLRELLNRLHDACETIDRDPGTVGVSVGLTSLAATSEGDLKERFERFASAVPVRPPTLDELRFDRLVGTGGEIAERIGHFEELGVEEIICSFGPVPFSLTGTDEIEAFAELVIHGKQHK